MKCSARRAESRGWSNSTLAADRIFIHSDTVRAALDEPIEAGTDPRPDAPTDPQPMRGPRDPGEPS